MEGRGLLITRVMPIIFAEDVAGVRDFYVSLLGFEIAFDSDWFANLKAPGNDAAEVAVWQRDHDLVPPAVRGQGSGVINVVVDDVDRVFAEAERIGLPIVLRLRDEPYGQRRFLTRDPAGTVLDISTPIAMSPELFAPE
ncbi:putative glyoxalase superfamily protein PhnB [Microlunatus parietis]|uniref:Putative glyoxalase superfamily protein PhnB n=2 Tax=Microlunatus parietis TaxID=682979 RepID=A0A7Y9I8Z7_9ACTN|nr:putative glyoxalase superfamily protein PhnB [Microlunatus parietis]